VQISSLAHYTRGTLHELFSSWQLLVSLVISILFHSPYLPLLFPKVEQHLLSDVDTFFSFPSQYFSLSLIDLLLGLEGGSPFFTQVFPWPVLLWLVFLFYIQDSSLPSMDIFRCFWVKIHKFGLYQFRSPLLSVSLLILFPLGTEMFHFPKFLPYLRCFHFKTH